MKSKLVSIVIPTWNRENHLSQCITSIQNQTYTHYEIIVIDNASVDSTINMLITSFPQVKIIKNATNLGPAIAKNQGIQQAKGHYLWFLDSDTKVENTNCLKNMLDLFTQHHKDKPLGAIGGEYIRKDPNLLVKKNLKFNFDTQNIYLTSNIVLEHVDYLPTSNFFTSKKIIQTTGGFHPLIPFRDDVWLSLKLKQKGYFLAIDERTTVFHNINIHNRSNLLFEHHKDRLTHYLLIHPFLNFLLLPFFEIISLFDRHNINKVTHNEPQVAKYIPTQLQNNYFIKNNTIIRFFIIGILYFYSLIQAYAYVLFHLKKIVRAKKNSPVMETSNI